jgi:hypothetical protein
MLNILGIITLLLIFVNTKSFNFLNFFIYFSFILKLVIMLTNVIHYQYAYVVFYCPLSSDMDELP